MKNLAAISLIMLVLFAGCGKHTSSQTSEAPQTKAPSQSESTPAPESSSEPEEAIEPSPEKAAEELIDSIKNIANLDNAKIKELAGQYLSIQSVPDEFYGILKPLSQRVSCKIGDSKIDEDKATVDVTVTTIDAKGAIDKIIPGAVAHLAVMQITGKDISHPEKILAEYAANNIKWDELPTIKKEASLHLVKRADGQWDVDATNPDNIGFLDAISGGAVKAAQDLRFLAEHNK